VKFKLDENLSRRAADLIRAAGHDTVTVVSQGLRGAADETLFEMCAAESRALVTLDRPRASPATDRRFKPGGWASASISARRRRRHSGARDRPRPTHAALLDRVRELLTVLRTRSPEGALWIVEPGRVRIHLPPDDDGQ
jgi:hypothetical protein